MHAVAARLDGATGSTEWQWTTPGGEVRALALDADGDVALTGPVLAAKLDGDTGSQLWRVEQTGTETSSQGAPVTRTVTVDRSGNVMVGGFLRNTFEDYRMFYMARFDGETGAYQWEFAGSPQTTLDGATRIIADRDGGVYAGGRLQTLPAMLRLKAGNGAFDWASQPWRQDTRPDAAWSVTDLSVDASCLYVSGSDGVQRFIVAAFNRTGKAKWLQDLGRGQALAQSLSSGALYLVGNLEASSGGLQSVVVSIQGSNGKQIKKRSK